jgi:hypothetical protein
MTSFPGQGASVAGTAMQDLKWSPTGKVTARRRPPLLAKFLCSGRLVEDELHGLGEDNLGCIHCAAVHPARSMPILRLSTDNRPCTISD